nr:GNAT family N-acetyltransferase [Mangrovicoccus algicola]
MADTDIRIIEDRGQAVAFAGLKDACFDLLFVHPDHGGRGHARRLHDRLVAEARAAGTRMLTAHASHVSRPVFAHLGWQAGAAAEAARGGVMLGFTVMTLRLELPVQGVQGRTGGSSARPGSSQ